MQVHVSENLGHLMPQGLSIQRIDEKERQWYLKKHEDCYRDHAHVGVLEVRYNENVCPNEQR